MSSRDRGRGLERWRNAGLLDDAVAARILEWEARRAEQGQRSRLTRFAFAFGGLLLAATVAALHTIGRWLQLSPASSTTTA